MPRSCKDTIIAAHHDEEDVDYTNLQRTSVDANGDLNTTSSQSLNQGWLSGASSVQTVNDDDYIEFEIENISTYNNNFLVGLSFQDNSTNLYESAYGFFVRNNGSVSIHLGSSTAVYTTSRSVGDKFRIERDNGTIRFKKNGVTIYSTTDTQQSTAMYADVSMWFQTGYVNRVYNLVVGKFVPETTKNVCYGNWQDASFGKYRYAYNGMEKDDEVSGSGNSYTTEFRQYDPRLGRWKSLDPLMASFPWQSPYCAFDNNPVYYVDPYGLSSSVEGEPPTEAGTYDGQTQEVDGVLWEWVVPNKGEGDAFWAKVGGSFGEVRISALDSKPTAYKEQIVINEGKYKGIDYTGWMRSSEAYELAREMSSRGKFKYGNTMGNLYRKFGWAQFDPENVKFSEAGSGKSVPFGPVNEVFVAEEQLYQQSQANARDKDKDETKRDDTESVPYVIPWYIGWEETKSGYVSSENHLQWTTYGARDVRKIERDGYVRAYSSNGWHVDNVYGYVRTTTIWRGGDTTRREYELMEVLGEINGRSVDTLEKNTYFVPPTP